MRLIENILANALLGILLTSCYILLPILLTAAFALDGILAAYTYLTALFWSAYHGLLSRCIHLVVVPIVVFTLTATNWIKSRRMDITSSLLLGILTTKLDTIRQMTVSLDVLPMSMQRVWNLVRHYAVALTNENHENNDHPQEILLNLVAEEVVVDEEHPPHEPDFVAEDLIEEPDIDGVVARVRTREEDRLHTYIEDLAALEAEGLPENMTTEHAILLMLTRTAFADGRGAVCYYLLETHRLSEFGVHPTTPAHLIMQPHQRHNRLYISVNNIYRPDEPDCAICYSPLVPGEAMVTHETCRRTFHEVCYEASLARHRICPFDREPIVPRPMLDVLPMVTHIQEGGLEQQQVAEQPVPAPPQLNAEQQTPYAPPATPPSGRSNPAQAVAPIQFPATQPVLGPQRPPRPERQAQRLLQRAQRPVPQAHQAGNRNSQIAGPGLERRPTNNRPRQNNGERRWAPRRAWR